MPWTKAHGAKGGPGQRLSERGALALKATCPTCGAKPGQRCVRKSDYGSTWQTRPDLGRAFFEARPGSSHKTRLPGPRHTVEGGRLTCWQDGYGFAYAMTNTTRFCPCCGKRLSTIQAESDEILRAAGKDAPLEV